MLHDSRILLKLSLLFGAAVLLFVVGRPEPAAAQAPAAPATASEPINWDKAQQLHRRREAGEKLSTEEQAYLERAMRERARQQSGGQAGGAASQPAGGSTIDWNKAKQLYQRSQAGEQLTPEEQAYLDRAERERGQQPGGNRPGGKAGSQPAPRETTGMPPLTDLSAEGRYKDQDGGLYGKGKNTPPEAQLALALRAAREIQPRDEAGQPAPDGKIVLITIGMSNTTQESSQFIALAKKDPLLSKHLVLVDGARRGQEGRSWKQSAENHDKGPFDVLAQRIKAAGVSPAQVEAAWIKLAIAGPANFGEFPEHSKFLEQCYAATVTHLKTRYPNLQVAYLSSRIYAGYANTGLNPEPYAYEEAYSVRWVIQDQMGGNSELNADPAKGAVKAPVLLWGPYLWADGTAGRKDNRLKWLREDLGGDGTHPSRTGCMKVAELLLDFFKTDPTTKPWFVGKP